MIKRVVLVVVDWLLRKFAPEWHRHKNPVRGQKNIEKEEV